MTSEQIFNSSIFGKALYRSLTYNDAKKKKKRRHFLPRKEIMQVFLTACVVDLPACRLYSLFLLSSLFIDTKISPNFIKDHLMPSSLTLNYCCSFVFISGQTAAFALNNIT